MKYVELVSVNKNVAVNCIDIRDSQQVIHVRRTYPKNRGHVVSLPFNKKSVDKRPTEKEESQEKKTEEPPLSLFGGGGSGHASLFLCGGSRLFLSFSEELDPRTKENVVDIPDNTTRHNTKQHDTTQHNTPERSDVKR